MRGDDKLFTGSSLAEHGDSLGFGQVIDVEAEISTARAGDLAQGAKVFEGKATTLPPQRYVDGPMPPARLHGATDAHGQLWAWREVDGRMDQPPHPASVEEAAALQRGQITYQSPDASPAGFRMPVSGVEEPSRLQEMWAAIPGWAKVTALIAVGVGGALAVEHYVVPLVRERFGGEGPTLELEEETTEAEYESAGA